MQATHIPNNLPPEGINIPLIASFGGFKNIPLLAYAHNSANPRLILFNDRIEFKLIRTKQMRYNQIEKVVIARSPFSHNLEFQFKGSIFTFVVNLGARENKIVLIEFFEHKGVSVAQ